MQGYGVSQVEAVLEPDFWWEFELTPNGWEQGNRSLGDGRETARNRFEGTVLFVRESTRGPDEWSAIQ
jgi:hypothetical protein